MAEIRRVLLVEPMAGARWRSITAYASSLAEMLRAGGIEVELAEAPWFNPPSLAAGMRRRWWRAPAIQEALAGKFDAIHLTDQALAHHAKRLGRAAPAVVTCHDLMPFTLPGYYATRRERWLKQAFLRKPTRALADADLVVAVSEFTERELRTRFDDLPVEVVPNVVRPAFRPIPRDEAERGLGAAGILLPPGLRILSVGNDRAYKNVEATLRALAQPALAHANLVRVGPLTESQRQLAQANGVLRRTVFPGSIADDALALVYAACDVLAQPSLAEGFGIPVIEAMACGLPVVVSDGGALPEVAGEAGVIVPLADSGFDQRLAAGVADAIARSEELRAAGIARAKQFEPSAVLPGLLAAYRRAASKGSSR